MSDQQDPDLQALFSRPAVLPDADRLQQQILTGIEQQQRRRGLWLGAAGVTGLLVPLSLLVASVGWPGLIAAISSWTVSLEHSSAGASTVLRVLDSQYALWAASAAGLVAISIAAARSVHPR